MRRFLFVLFDVVALAAVCLPGRAMSVADLQKQQEAGARLTVIDTRSPQDFAREHIPGAINIPAAVCPQKTLPPMGEVVVYGDGLVADPAEGAAAALAAKPGLKVSLLDGGFAAWKSGSGLTTRGAGVQREQLNYISYARLKAAKLDNVVLFDLRKAAAAKGKPLTDLAAEFPGARRAKSREAALGGSGGNGALVVLVDSGDGAAEIEARKLKAAGAHNYMILAGGELILARKGQAGLERSSSVSSVTAPKPPAGSAK
jgi:rhodanese-related sulfurtransferase